MPVHAARSMLSLCALLLAWYHFGMSGRKDAGDPLQEGGTSAAPCIPGRQPAQSDEEYRQVLIAAIAEIDKTKRDIKGQIHSAAITAKANRCSIDQIWLRRAKDKIDHLTREREEVRKALHTVKECISKSHRDARNRPALNSAAKRNVPAIAQSFMEVAEERLPPGLYDSLLDEAAERIVHRGLPPDNEA